MKQDINSSIYKDREVDNKGFFEAMEEGLPSILSSVEIHQRARLDLQILLADMKTKKFIQGTTQWTASEQGNFFEIVRQEVLNAGIAASLYIKEKIKPLIEDEIWREINDTGKKEDFHDKDITAVDLQKLYGGLDISSLFTKEISMIPLDLRLTIGKTETIEDAKRKLEKYHGRYNALILVEEGVRPIGIITSDLLEKNSKFGQTKLGEITFIPDVYGYLSHSADDIKGIMKKFGINILPIIDSKTRVLIGILTDTAVEMKELQYYSTTSLTELSLDYLKMNN